MSNFKIGEKVVCIDPNHSCKKGEIYTVTEIIVCSCCKKEYLGFGVSSGIPFFKCCGKKVVSSDNWKAYSYRFRKLDHQFAEDVCAQLIEEHQTETV